MKVELISVTPNAWELLLGTKSTRMRGKEVSEMTEDEKRANWAYMLDTIRSPFEFVDYIFNINGVSKNFTHQLVRTRQAAYQQETSRALDMTGTPVVAPEFRGDESLISLFAAGVHMTDSIYKELVASGAELQDARAILPGNMETAIKAKFNLRTLSDMGKLRLCTRTAGEYQEVFRLMRDLVLAIHPWADSLLQPHCIAVGTCAFPRHGREHCTFYRPWMNLDEQREELRKVFWATDITTNNPVAKDGMSNA